MLGKSKVKYIQSLGQKKLRDEEGLFIAEGPKIIVELLSSAHTHIQEMYALSEWLDAHQQELKNRPVIVVDEVELGRISQLSTPNQVVAIVKKFDEPVVRVSNTVSLMLDGIQDPGNLGTIIRIADWFGVSQIICSRDCADMYNSKVVQSTMGSIARVKVLYTSLEEWLAGQQGIDIYATSLKGQDVTAMKPITEGIIVIGNESKGISADIMKRVTTSITIPKKGNAESLNAAVAAGIVLSHLV
ncbi:MAG: RNA methyltransferase [Chitinophagaceae bacterium]